MMKRMAAVSLAFFLATTGTITGTGYARDAGNGDVEMLKQVLSSGSSAHRVKIAKDISKGGIEDPALYEKIAAFLKDGYADGMDSDHVDEMSWLCKALAASGDPKYKGLLREVAAQASTSKLRNYASQSHDLIEEYAERMQILNSTKTSDDALSREENRMVQMLNSNKIQLKRDAAKTIVRSISVHGKVFDAVAAELAKMQADQLTGSEEIDTMGWLCKALAVSGNSKYAETLKQVRLGTTSPKLKTYASKALNQIDK